MQFVLSASSTDKMEIIAATNIPEFIQFVFISNIMIVSNIMIISNTMKGGGIAQVRLGVRIFFFLLGGWADGEYGVFGENELFFLAGADLLGVYKVKLSFHHVKSSRTENVIYFLHLPKDSNKKE